MFLNGLKRLGKVETRNRGRLQDAPEGPKHRPQEKTKGGNISLFVAESRSIPSQMSPIAFKRDFFISFMVDKLHDGRNSIEPGSWWVLHAMDRKTAVIALDALATMFYGRAFRHVSLIQEGMGHYTKALSGLRLDLQGSDGFSISTLAATCEWESP